MKIFVIMDFSKEFDWVYDVIKEICKNLGYFVTRVDENQNQQNIIFDIIDKIYNFDLIIADLTNLNPNVFYELGISHALKKKTIMLTQKIDELPFDLKTYRIIKYSRDYEDVENLKKSLIDIFENYDNLTFGNPVSDYFTTQSKDITIESEKVLEIEEKGYLDYLKDIDDSTKEITCIFNLITEDTMELGSKFYSYSKNIKEIEKSPNKINEIYKIAQDLAKDISEYSNKIDEKLPILEKNTDLLESGILNYLRHIDTPKDRDTLNYDKQKFEEGKEASDILISQIKKFQFTISNLKSIQIDLNKSCSLLINKLNNLIIIVDKIKSIHQKAIYLIDMKLNAIIDE